MTNVQFLSKSNFHSKFYLEIRVLHLKQYLTREIQNKIKTVDKLYGFENKTDYRAQSASPLLYNKYH